MKTEELVMMRAGPDNALPLSRLPQSNTVDLDTLVMLSDGMLMTAIVDSLKMPLSRDTMVAPRTCTAWVMVLQGGDVLHEGESTPVEGLTVMDTLAAAATWRNSSGSKQVSDAAKSREIIRMLKVNPKT
jgi:hypothetical protein